MTKPNKSNQKPKLTIQINRNRGGGKKRPDLFANIRNLEHPLDSMFPDEQVISHPELFSKTLDSQISEDRIAKTEIIGYPIIQNLDSQPDNIGYPSSENLDSQKINIGYPNSENLDSLIAKNDIWIAKKPKNLDSKIAKDLNLDSQTEEKKINWKKYDTKRSAKGVFLRTNDDLTKRFKQFCIGKDWDFSYGTELAWNKLMTDLDSQTSGDLDSLIALDNRRLMIMFKTNNLIINLYLAYNSVFNEISEANSKGKWSARWTPRDDEAAFRYNNIAPMIVELGIIQTQMNKGFGQSKIQTFKYYLDEIEKVLTSGVNDETLETILQYHRQIWKNTTKREIDLSFMGNEKETE